jgi:hypothetical protein
VRSKGGRPHIVKISYDAAQTVDRNSSPGPGYWTPGQRAARLAITRPAQPGDIWSGGVRSQRGTRPQWRQIPLHNTTPSPWAGDPRSNSRTATTRRTRFPPKTALQLSLTRKTNVPNVPRNWLCGSADLAQTRAVSLLNRQTAPAAKIASHAMTLTTQVQSTPPPSSGACTSWLSPYSGDHLAMS